MTRGRAWTWYAAEVATGRYRFSLAPPLDKPLNLAQSLIKLSEHAVTGAPSVFSSNWTEAPRVWQKDAGICVTNVQKSWIEAVSQLINAPERARDVVGNARQLAATLNDPAPQRQLWQSLFDLKDSVVA